MSQASSHENEAFQLHSAHLPVMKVSDCSSTRGTKKCVVEGQDPHHVRSEFFHIDHIASFPAVCYGRVRPISYRSESQSQKRLPRGTSLGLNPSDRVWPSEFKHG